VLDPEFVVQALQRGPDTLQRHPRAPDRGERVRLGEPDEGHRHSGFAGQRGDDRLTGDCPLAPARIAVCPGSEGRHWDIDVQGSLGYRVQRHGEAFVGGGHGHRCDSVRDTRPR
jgi:hypothetical protein